MRRAVLFGVVLVASLFVVSFASANLVGYLSNSVTATVTVLPPEPPEEPDMPMKLSDCVPPVAHNNYGWMKYVDENNETIFRGPNQCLQHVIKEVCKSDDNPFKNQGLCVAAGAPGRQIERAIDSCLYDNYEDEEGFFECITSNVAPGQSSAPAPSAVEENITEELKEEIVEEKDELDEEKGEEINEEEKEESKEKDELEEEKPEKEDDVKEESDKDLDEESEKEDEKSESDDLEEELEKELDEDEKDSLENDLEEDDKDDESEDGLEEGELKEEDASGEEVVEDDE